MPDSGYASVDATASDDAGVDTSDSPALTTTDDLAVGIAQTYGLSSQGKYMFPSRLGEFQASFRAEPPQTRERRRPFVLASYLKSTGAVNTFQPTGYAVPRNLTGMETLQESQFNPLPNVEGGDPIDNAFSPQDPALDRKAKDTVRPEEEGRLIKEVDMRRRAIHVNKGRKDQYDYQG
jgi:hypothetical protein